MDEPSWEGGYFFDKGDPMKTPRFLQHLNKCLVQFPKSGGQGFYIPGGMILTAGHCLANSGDGSDYSVENSCCRDICPVEAINSEGSVLILRPRFVDFASDLAILEDVTKQIPIPDRDIRPLESEEHWESIKPFVSRFRLDPVFQDDSGWLRTHDQGWQPIRISETYDAPNRFAFLTEGGFKVEGGTSGGPIVDRQGYIVGAVSSASEDLIWDESREDYGCLGEFTHAASVLPNWYVSRFISGDGMGKARCFHRAKTNPRR